MLPLGVSAVTLGYGYLVTFDEPPLALRDRAIMIPLVHAVVGVPFVVRLLVPARRAIAPAMREAAATMGATPLTVTRTIVVPLLAPALAAAAGFAVVLSLGEFGATSMLVRRGPVTAPIAIGQWLGVPGEVAQHAAYALAAVLAAGAVLVMVLTDVWSARAGRQSS
jgi:thiamine transport system permease protein